MITTLRINGEEITESDNINVINNFIERKVRDILFSYRLSEINHNDIHKNVDINIY